MIFCLTEPHWRSLARLMGREELIESPRYKDHASRYRIVGEVDGLVGQWTKLHRRGDLVTLFIDHGIPCAPVRSVAEVTADPELERRRMLIGSESVTRGKIKVMGTPLKITAAETRDDALIDRPLSPPPALGEHTAEVLATVGIDEAELSRLRASGII
jgi:formyl-CoA transferase